MEPTVAWLDASAIDDRLRSEWSDLVERCADASIFQTPEWVLPWWKHFAEGHERVVTVRRAGRLVALVPLVELRRRGYGLHAKVLAFAGEPLADRLGLVVDDTDAEAADVASRALVAGTGDFDVVELSELDVDGAGERAIARAIRAAGTVAAERVCSRAPVLRLDRPWDEVSQAFSKSLRTRLKRARRRQAERGDFAFTRWQPAADAVPGLLQRFRDIEDRSWKGDRGVGVFAEGARWAFMNEIAHGFSARGWLDVATLENSERLIAYRFGFRFRGVFLDFNLAHDPDASEFSPGRTLLDDVVRDSHRIGLKAVDASRGKLSPPHLLADWTSESRWHQRRLLFGRSVRGRALAALEKHVKPAARRIRGDQEPDLPGGSVP